MPDNGSGEKGRTPDHQDMTDDHTNDKPPLPPKANGDNTGGGLFGLVPRKAGPGWSHNKKLGYKGTQGMLAQQFDQDGDMDMSEEGKAKANEKVEKETTQGVTEWAVVEHHRDTLLVVKVAFDDLAGTSQREKLADLMDILMDNRVSPPRTPTKMKIDGRLFFRVPVTTQAEMECLLEGVVDNTLDQEDESDDDSEEDVDDDDGISEILEEDEEGALPERTGPMRRLFERVDIAAEKKHDMARSIELYGLPARVNMELLKLAANQLGEVENISLKGCARGIKMVATIWYQDVNNVETLKQHQVQHVAVGSNLTRVRRLGEENVQWELQHACKLHGLPRATTPVMVMAALRTLQVKVNFVEVPRFYTNNGNQVRYRQEAFVYFRNEADMTEAMDTPIKMGESELVWLHTKEKRCYTCNGAMHEGTKCPVLVKQIENREHKKKVMDFHTKPRNGVRTGTTFADLVREKGQERGNLEGRQDKGKKRAQWAAETTQARTAEPQAAQATQAAQAAQATRVTQVPQSNIQARQADISKTVTELMAKQKTLEATMADMQQTMQQTMRRMMETQNNLMEKVNTMFAEMKTMMASVMTKGTPNQSAHPVACSQEEETLVNNRTKRQKQEPGRSSYNAAPNPLIPSPNESRAGIDAAITTHQKAGGPLGNKGTANITRANQQHHS